MLFLTPASTYDDVVHELYHGEQFGATHQDDLPGTLRGLDAINKKYHQTVPQLEDLLSSIYTLIKEYPAYQLQLNTLKAEVGSRSKEFEAEYVEGNLYSIREMDGDPYRRSKIEDFQGPPMEIAMSAMQVNSWIKNLDSDLMKKSAVGDICHLLKDRIRGAPPYDFESNFPACKHQ